MFQVNPLHLKHQALFSSKDKSKKVKCCLLQFLFGALKVKLYSIDIITNPHLSKQPDITTDFSGQIPGSEDLY